MVRTVIFDLGGTLIEYSGAYNKWPDLEIPGIAAAHSYLAGQGMPVPALDVLRQSIFEILPKRWRMATEGVQNLTVADLLAGALMDNGVEEIVPELLAAAAHQYEAAICSDARPIAHGRETLKKLREEGYLLGLISNTMFSGASHLEDLKRFGLAEYFDAMLFSADTNKWKPTAAPFLHILQRLGSHPNVAAFIGDDPRVDVDGAKVAGLYSIHFQSSDRFPKTNSHTPDAVIQDLRELSPILARLNG